MGRPPSLTDIQVRLVVQMLKDGKLIVDISRELEISYILVHRIANGKAYMRITGGPLEYSRTKSPFTRKVNGFNCKLTKEKVLKIIELNRNGIAGIELAKQFGVSPPTINNILNGKTWTNVTGGPTVEAYKIPHDCRSKGSLTEKQVGEIVHLLSIRMKGKDIAKLYGISQPAVSDIATGKTWTHITGGPVEHNTIRGGARCLSNKEVLEIKRLIAIGLNHYIIRRCYGISSTVMTNISSGRSYKEITL